MAIFPCVIRIRQIVRNFSNCPGVPHPCLTFAMYHELSMIGGDSINVQLYTMPSEGQERPQSGQSLFCVMLANRSASPFAFPVPFVPFCFSRLNPSKHGELSVRNTNPTNLKKSRKLPRSPASLFDLCNVLLVVNDLETALMYNYTPCRPNGKRGR
jgi:hypothetical protein